MKVKEEVNKREVKARFWVKEQKIGWKTRACLVMTWLYLSLSFSRIVSRKERREKKECV